MFFKKPEDINLLQKLYDHGALTMSMYQGWDKPEEGNLIDVVMANADKIDAKKWITSIIKGQGALRYENPKVEAVIFHSLDLDIPAIRHLFDIGIYPLTTIGNAIWIGAVRADYATTNWHENLFEGFSEVFVCAISPKEALEAQEVYKLYSKQVLKSVELYDK